MAERCHREQTSLSCSRVPGRRKATAFGRSPFRHRPPLSRIRQPDGPTHRLDERHFASADGRRFYRIDVAIPVGAPPADGWPAFVMLDGNALFETLGPADLALVPDAAIVGIGYDPMPRRDGDARTQDYTPPFPADDPVDPADPEPEAGGADIFLTLLAEYILPSLSIDFSLDPSRRMLWGHSYGGLFALNTLFKQPDLFRSYYAVSPSVRWHAPLILDLEAASPRRASGVSQVALLYEIPDEAALDPGRKARLGQARAVAAELLRRLQERADIAVVERRFPGETHGSMFRLGLNAALAGPRPG